MRVLLSAGEASGDAYGAALVKELRALRPELEIAAIGGPLLAKEGVRLLADSSSWGAVGIFEALKVAPRILHERGPFEKELEKGKPGLFIPIDFGALNVGLARKAKALGWCVLYFIPPGSWRRNRVGKDLARVTDAIVTPFEWNAELLRAQGANVHWFGHPILQLIGSLEEAQRREQIAVLPGSRSHEVRLNLPVIAEAFQKFPQPLTFLCAPGLGMRFVESLWNGLAPGRQDRFVSEGKYEVLKSAKLAVVCSGTATLESTLCGAPTLVLYKLDALSHLQGYIMGLKGKSISLPNILLEERMVSEFVGRDVSAGALRTEAERLLAEPDAQKAQLARLRAILGGSEAIRRAAPIAIDLLER